MLFIVETMSALTRSPRRPAHFPLRQQPSSTWWAESFTPPSNANDIHLQGSALLEEQLAVRDVESMPPLLQRLSEVQPPALDYLGVSYGLTASLLKFWKKSGYVPLYVRQTPNDLTGEFTTVMVRGVGHSSGSSKSPQVEWLTEFAKGLHRVFIG